MELYNEVDVEYAMGYHIPIPEIHLPIPEEIEERIETQKEKERDKSPDPRGLCDFTYGSIDLKYKC